MYLYIACSLFLSTIPNIEHEIGFCHLDMNSVAKAFKSTRRRVLLFDLNGTIVYKEPPGKYLKRDENLSGMSVDPEVGDLLST